MPRYNSEKMLPRNILPWKILWFFAKTIFLNICCLDIFLKINLPTETGQQPAKFMKILFMHSTSAKRTSLLTFNFLRQRKNFTCPAFAFSFVFRRNFAPADGLPFQCNLAYFYYIFGRRRFSTFLFSVAHLPQKWPPCRCQNLTEVSHKKNWRTPKEIYTIFVVFYSFDSWTLEKDMPQWLTDVKSTGKLFLRR